MVQQAIATTASRPTGWMWPAARDAGTERGGWRTLPGMKTKPVPASLRATTTLIERRAAACRQCWRS